MPLTGFMENKKTYQQFVAVNLHKKTTLRLMKIYWLEKSLEARDKLQDTISKGGKVNKLWQKSFNQH